MFFGKEKLRTAIKTALLRQVVFAFVFAGMLNNSLLLAKEVSPDVSTLAPKSIYATKDTGKTYLENLENAAKNPFALKLILKAMEKMNKQGSLLYEKVLSSAEGQTNKRKKSSGSEYDIKSEGFWYAIRQAKGEKRTHMLNVLASEHFVQAAKLMNAFNLDLSNEIDRALVLDVANLYVEKEPSSLIQYFDLLTLNPDIEADRNEIVKLAKACVNKRHVMTVATNFYRLGLDPKKKSHRNAVFEIANLCAEVNPSNTAFHFEHFGLSASRQTERAAVIEIAKKCADGGTENTLKHLADFGLDGRNFKDKKAVIEIAKVAAKSSTVSLAENFQKLGLDSFDSADQKAILEIIDICAENDPGRTLYNFSKFGFSTKLLGHRQTILDLADKFAKSVGGITAQYFSAFGLNPDRAEDYPIVVDLAKKCAASDALGTAEYFKNFRLNGSLKRDKQDVIDIAKLCAKNSKSGIARYFLNFNLDGSLESDRKDVLEIALISAKQNGRETGEYIRNFKLDSKLEANQKALTEIATTCAMHFGHDTYMYFKYFDMDFNAEGLDSAVLRYLLNGKDIPWDEAKLEALRGYLEDGLLDQMEINLKKLYMLLRNENLIMPDELDYIKHTEFFEKDENAAAANLALLDQEDRLIEHNNNAIKLLGAKHLNKTIAISAIAETEKMLKIYAEMFEESMDLEVIASKLKNLKEIVLADEDKLSDQNKRLLRDITGNMVTLQDVIVYLHQHSIRKMFEKFSAEKERAGSEINFKIGVANAKAVDILNLEKKDLFYSGVKFLQDFYHDRLKVLLGMNTIVAGKKLYHFFRLGVHTAKMAIDLHSPTTGGNILFEYNENEFDSLNKGNKADLSGNDIRQLVLEEVLRRSGMQVKSEGLNVHAVYGKETGAVSVEDLTNMYDKIYYVMHILGSKTFTIDDETYNLSDTFFGMEYRKRKTPQLYPDMKMIKKMVHENANIIEKIIDVHRSEYDQYRQDNIEFKGYGELGLNTMEYLEKTYQELAAPKTVLDSMTDIAADTKIFEESRKIGDGMESIKDLFVWEDELVAGKYRLIKTDVEIGYKDKDTMYALEDTRSGKIIVGWLKRGVTGEIVHNNNEFYRRLKKEGLYPVSKERAKYDISLKDFAKEMQKDISDAKVEQTASGLSVSPGKVDGEVVFYRRGEHTAADLRNNLVVVDNLTPEDDSFMLEAAGLIILKGGALSHGAIFAREIGVPAVILNSFNIENGKLKGKLSTKAEGRQENIKIASADVKVSFLESIERDWNISEGDIISVDGDKGKLSHVSDNKQYILKEFSSENPDIAKIIAVAKKDKLGQWLYDMAYIKKQQDVMIALEKNNPAFKNYGQLVKDREAEQKHQYIEALIISLSEVETKWEAYKTINKLQQALSGISLDERKQYELRAVASLKTKNIFKAKAVAKEDKFTAIDQKDYYDLGEVNESLMNILGNKVAKLGGETISVVKEAGGHVPAGVGINGNLSRLFYEMNYNGRPVKDTIKAILKKTDSPAKKSRQIQDILNSQEFLLSEEYISLLARLDMIYEEKWGEGNVDVAVRSSAIRDGKQLEDTLGTAGLYKSLMFVGKNDFAESVMDVWRSLYSEEAINYYFNVMREADTDSLVDELMMGVVGQEMVDSDASVVVFSADPVTGSDEIIITVGYGQGEGVVSGTVPVDTIVVNAKTGKVIRRDIVKKDEMMVKLKGAKELKKINIEAEAAKKTNILFVCTDNTCRSVMSEYILRDILKDKEDVNITSAGIYSGRAEGAGQETVSVLGSMGIDASAHRAQTLTDEMLEEADLVIAMSDYQKDELVEFYKGIEDKTMIITSFDKKREFDDIKNPYGPHLEIYQELAAELKDIFKDGQKIYSSAVELKNKELAEKMNEAALSDEEIARIVEIVKALADEYETPQDVEIALKKSRINVVQRRMITTLGIDEGRLYFKELLRANLQERISLGADRIRESFYAKISYIDFVARMSLLLDEADETFVTEEVIALIEKEWNNFRILSEIPLLSKADDLVKQAA